MQIRAAKTEDIPRILEIYEIGRAFMRSHQNPTQWKDGYPSKEIIEDDIAKNQCFVAEDHQHIYGVFAFILGEDPTYRTIYQGAWPHNGCYGTIHRIAGDGTRKGLLKSALDFALSHTKTVRADTHHDNFVMQNALKNLGFQYCGIIYLQNGEPRLAFQYR